MTLRSVWEYYKNSVKTVAPPLVPALAAATVAAGVGQKVLETVVEEPSDLLTQICGYGSAYAIGYSVFLLSEFKMHNEKYPNGFFSKEMRNMLISFVSADYVADFIFYTPEFVLANQILLDYGADKGIAGLVAGTFASTTYLLGAPPIIHVTAKATQKVNEGVASAYHGLEREVLDIQADTDGGMSLKKMIYYGLQSLSSCF